MSATRLLQFLGFIAVLGPSLALAQGSALYFSRSASSVWIDNGAIGWSHGPGGPYNSAWQDGFGAIFEGTAGTVNVSGAIASVSSLDFSVDGYTLAGGTINLTGPGGVVATGAASDVISSVLTGSVGLTKLGPGTAILNGSNTYTGTTTISGGTLQLGDGTPGHDASLAGGGIINNATLVYKVFNSQAASYAISGSGSLVKSGSGTLTVTGVNTFGGGDSNGDVFGVVSIHKGNVLVGAGGVLTNNTSEIAVGDAAGLTGTLTMSGGTALTPWGTPDKSGVNVGINGGSGVVTLSGSSLLDASCTANNNTGGTNASFSNVVAIGLASSFGTVTVGGTSTLRSVQGSPVSNGSAISVGEGGAGALIVQSQGQVQAANFYLGGAFYGTAGGTGSLYLNGGTVSVPSVQNSGSTAGCLWFNGGALQATASSADFISAGGTLNVYVQAGGAVIDSNGNNITVNQPLQHDASGPAVDGGLTKMGAGMLALTGLNTFTGNLTVSAGTLGLPSGYLAPGSAYVGSSGTGTFTHSGGTVSTATLYLGASAGDAGTYFLSGSALLSASTEYVGYGGSGTFTQTGGTNTISNELVLGNSSGAGGTYNLNGGLLVVPNILQGSASASASLNIAGGILSGGTAGSVISLPIVLTSLGSSSTFNTSVSSLTLAGQISGLGGLTKTGSATLSLSGNNTYSGNTNVSQGALLLANSNAARNSTVNVGVSNGLVFSAGIGAFNVGSIGGSGNLVLANTGGGAITLVTGGNNAITTYSGVISGPGTLSHGGSGTLVLSGSNTYSGGTILAQDAGFNECVTNNASFGTGPILWTGDNTVCYLGNLAFSNTVNIASNAMATQDTMGYAVGLSGPISGPGNLNKTGMGSLVLSGSNNDSGDTTINQGTLQLANSAAVQASTVNVNVDNGLQFNSGIGDFSVGGLSGGNALTLSDTSGAPVMLMVGGNNADTMYSGAIGGNGGLVKEGMGMIALSGDNSFSGGTVLDPGVVSINGDAALGSPTGSAAWGGLKGNIIFAASSTLQADASFALSASRSIVIGPGAIATFDTQSYALTIDGPISGSGGLEEIGTGTLVLTGSDTYTGGTIVADGTLEVMSPDSLPEGGRLIVGQDATAIFAPAASLLASPANAVAVPEPGTPALFAAALWSAVIYWLRVKRAGVVRPRFRQAT